jgi:hypothetical protein
MQLANRQTQQQQQQQLQQQQLLALDQLQRQCSRQRLGPCSLPQASPLLLLPASTLQQQLLLLQLLLPACRQSSACV